MKGSTESTVIALIEMAAINGTMVCLDTNQTTVGDEVHVRHIAPAPIGSKVIAHALLTEARGNRFTFNVYAFKDDKK